MASIGRRVLKVIAEATRRYFVAGLLVIAPIGVTLWAVWSIIQWLDALLLPRVLKLVVPGVEGPLHVPVVGALFTFAAIILVGVIARHLFGSELVRIWERALSRVPVARSIYAGVKQLSEAILTSSQRPSFRRVVLVEYPRKGVFALAFTTGPAQGAVQQVMPKTMINCFVPTTPNPTSGFYLLVPEDEVIDVTLTVEEAFKLVMSAGLVSPENTPTVEQPARRPRRMISKAPAKS